MNFELGPRTIFLTLAGSRAYGFASPDSDYDYRGVAVPPLDTYIGIKDKFEQASDDKTKHVWTHYKGIVEPEADMQVYEVTKFVRLAASCNPSIIEILFTDPKTQLVKHPIMDRLLDNKHLFLSKQAKPRFCGYALSQLKRIQRHKRWLDQPPEKCPERKDFKLSDKKLIPLDQLGAADALIQRELDSFMVEQTDLPEHTKIEFKAEMHKIMRATWLAINGSTPYPVNEFDDEAEWNSTEQSLRDMVAKYEGFSENFLEILGKEKKYRRAKQEWDQYQGWLKNRNPDRAELEKKFGYDCYSDDTEFLTELGWKKFEDVSDEDRLATVNMSDISVEYQRPIDKFAGTIDSGNLYNLHGNHLDSLVTSNHRMLYRKIERRSEKKYDLKLEVAATLPDTFEVLRAPSPKKTTYSNTEAFASLPVPPRVYLRIMGWYLSDGTMAFKPGQIPKWDSEEFTSRGPKEIRVSQKKGGRLCWHITRFQNKWGNKVNSSLYEYTNPPNGFRKKAIQEKILSIRNKTIVWRMVNDCGFKKGKRIPRWAFTLSKRLMDILLEALHRGDGTDRPDGGQIYYSSLKGLADDVQELALMCGYETSLYGPYNGIYQVHINKTREQFKKCIRSHNVKKVPVDSNYRVVCFTVPNGTLITRRNGHIGIHGNSKHACHLVRLIRMAREILESGEVNVYRPDAEELRDIRAGAWTYEQIVEFAEKEDVTLVEVAKNSKLPKVPDINMIHELVHGIVVDFNEEFNEEFKTKNSPSFKSKQ